MGRIKILETRYSTDFFQQRNEVEKVGIQALDDCFFDRHGSFFSHGGTKTRRLGID